MKWGRTIASVIFFIVTLAHIARLLFQINITVGGTIVPMWISFPGVVIPALLSWELWNEARAR
jgi:hypothetical protein